MIGYIVKFSWLKSRNFKSSWAKVQDNQGHKTKKHALANCVRRIQKLIGVSSLVEIVFPIWKQLQTQMIRFRKILLERVPITLFLVRNYSTIYSHTVCIHTPNSRQVSMRWSLHVRVLRDSHHVVLQSQLLTWCTTPNNSSPPRLTSYWSPRCLKSFRSVSVCCASPCAWDLPFLKHCVDCGDAQSPHTLLFRAKSVCPINHASPRSGYCPPLVDSPLCAAVFTTKRKTLQSNAPVHVADT